MKLLLTMKLVAALFLEDMPPQQEPTYVCRTNISSPAGFDFQEVNQIIAGDIVVAYEDMCPEAIERFANGEGTYRAIPR